jgi:hypothetical protein
MAPVYKIGANFFVIKSQKIAPPKNGASKRRKSWIISISISDDGGPEKR